MPSVLPKELPKARKRRGFKFYLGMFAATCVAWGLFCVYLAQRPDREIEFVREVPVTLSPQSLNDSLWNLPKWRKWHFSMASVQRVDAPEQVLQKGARLLFHIDPKKGKRRRFDLMAEVTDYQPGKSVALRMISDSSGRLTRLFDRLEWRIELEQNPLRVRGTEVVHTRHWRARLFSALSERLVMNQVFYPDLLKLARPQAADLPDDK